MAKMENHPMLAGFDVSLGCTEKEKRRVGLGALSAVKSPDWTTTHCLLSRKHTEGTLDFNRYCPGFETVNCLESLLAPTPNISLCVGPFYIIIAQGP